MNESAVTGRARPGQASPPAKVNTAGLSVDGLRTQWHMAGSRRKVKCQQTNKTTAPLDQTTAPPSEA